MSFLMHLLALGAFWLPGVSYPLRSGETLRRIASGRKSTPPANKHEARLPDFSLRLLASPRYSCGADAVPEIAAIVGVSLLHNASHLESNCKVVEWKDRQ